MRRRDPKLDDLYILDDEYLLDTFTKEQLIDMFDDLLKVQVDLLAGRMSELGIKISYHGGINPRDYSAQSMNSGCIGLKVYIPDK